MSPDLLATYLILVSAMLHAVVNAMVKVSDDGLLTRGCMNATALIVAAPLTLLVPAPSVELWQILLIATLIHGLYPFFLVGAYGLGDLSAVFPLARGAAPLGVALFLGIFTNASLTPGQLASVAIISFAVASFAFEHGALGTARRRRGILLALLTSLIIACYTVIDGIGLRVAETPATYIIWLFVLDGAFVSIAVTAVRRHAVVPFLKQNWRSAFVGGGLGVLTYGLALYALSLGAIVEVAALRETSVIFAALIGAVLLGEAFGIRRVMGAVLVATGVILMRISG